MTIRIEPLRPGTPSAPASEVEWTIKGIGRYGTSNLAKRSSRRAAIKKAKMRASEGERIEIRNLDGTTEVIRQGNDGSGRRDPGAKFDADFLDSAMVDPQEAERHGVGWRDLEDDI